jgi:hypothetical protein
LVANYQRVLVFSSYSSCGAGGRPAGLVELYSWFVDSVDDNLHGVVCYVSYVLSIHYIVEICIVSCNPQRIGSRGKSAPH